jgi:hypothetical protein
MGGQRGICCCMTQKSDQSIRLRKIEGIYVACKLELCGSQCLKSCVWWVCWALKTYYSGKVDGDRNCSVKFNQCLNMRIKRKLLNAWLLLWVWRILIRIRCLCLKNRMDERFENCGSFATWKPTNERNYTIMHLQTMLWFWMNNTIPSIVYVTGQLVTLSLALVSKQQANPQDPEKDKNVKKATTCTLQVGLTERHAI